MQESPVSTRLAGYNSVSPSCSHEGRPRRSLKGALSTVKKEAVAVLKGSPNCSQKEAYPQQGRVLRCKQERHKDAVKRGQIGNKRKALIHSNRGLYRPSRRII